MSDGNTRPNLISLKSDYRSILSQMDDPYSYAEGRSTVIDSNISDAQERVKAFPSEEVEHESLIQAVMEAQALWEECESRLRVISGESTANRTIVAAQINQSSAKATEYREMFSSAMNNMVANTSAIYQFGESMKAAGQTMQNAGNAMKSAGHSMTIGCTIPIISLLLLLFLLMFLL